MKKFIVVIVILSFLISCSETKKRSEIEKITYHSKLDYIQEIADTVYDRFSKDSTVRYETYQFDTNSIAFASYRSDTLKAIVFRVSGVDTSVAEYYPNGQICGKLKFSKEGRLNGPVTYYYEDGRVRTIGVWTNSKKTGKWENYKDDGFLEKVDYFDEKGKIINTETIKN